MIFYELGREAALSVNISLPYNAYQAGDDCFVRIVTLVIW